MALDMLGVEPHGLNCETWIGFNNKLAKFTYFFKSMTVK